MLNIRRNKDSGVTCESALRRVTNTELRVLQTALENINITAPRPCIHLTTSLNTRSIQKTPFGITSIATLTEDVTFWSRSQASELVPELWLPWTETHSVDDHQNAVHT